METVTDDETIRFLSGIFYRYGMQLFHRLCELYPLNDEQKEAIQEILFSPGDWQVSIQEAILPELRSSSTSS